MRACVITRFGGRNTLKIKKVKKPAPGEGEVLVKVVAAGINPVDWKIREGLLKERGYPHTFPIILGWDMAGIVEECGHSARRFGPGDKVFAYARRPTVQQGTYAEYIVVPESYLVNAPAGFPLDKAAAVPLASLTAYQSLFDACGLRRGETAVILGASGGVGSFAVQLARIAGAKVAAVASKKNHAYLKKLGARKTFDYNDEDWAQKVRSLKRGGADVVFACAGGETLKKGYDCLRKGGRLATIVEPGSAALARSKGIELHYVFVEPNSRQLDEIRQWIEKKRIKIPVRRFQLRNVKKAHERIETEHTRGKLVLRI